MYGFVVGPEITQQLKQKKRDKCFALSPPSFVISIHTETIAAQQTLLMERLPKYK